jgi:hypothetical protein
MHDELLLWHERRDFPHLRHSGGLARLRLGQCGLRVEVVVEVVFEVRYVVCLGSTASCTCTHTQ